MRRRPHDDDPTAPPEHLVRFDGAPYFHDPELWDLKLNEWCAAREQWERQHGVELDLEPGAIPDAPWNPGAI